MKFFVEQKSVQNATKELCLKIVVSIFRFEITVNYSKQKEWS